MKTLVACALALAMAAPALGHAAATGEDVNKVAVRYGDLDLRDPGHAQIMLRRLDEAALQACGASSFSLREYRQAVRGSACHRDSLGRAVAQLGAPAVSQAYDVQSRRPRVSLDMR